MNAQTRGEAVSQSLSNNTLFTRDNIEVTIITCTFDSGTFEVTVDLTAKINNEAINIPEDALPFIYINPPTKVKTASGSIVDDVQAASEIIIIDTIKRFI